MNSPKQPDADETHLPNQMHIIMFDKNKKESGIANSVYLTYHLKHFFLLRLEKSAAYFPYSCGFCNNSANY